MGSVDGPIELDALVVGAGFGGVYQLKKLRDKGFSVKLVEAGDDYGGVWYWNRYPGARVDSTVPHYEFDDPAIWKDWFWSQRFPGSAEIRAYFAHVADRWDLRKDTKFNTYVRSAHWNEETSRWLVTTDTTETYIVRFLLLNTGFAAKRYIPDWEGIADFKGTFIHPSYWPHEEPDLKNKKVAVIGTGSTGIQIAQEMARVAGKLVVFQRTPNTSMPMGQVNYPETDGPSQERQQPVPRDALPDLFKGRTSSYGGFSFNFTPRSTFDDDAETRRALYESLWARGDFHYWLATYADMLFNDAANREAYGFWRDKVRARIQDPRCRDLLAPMEPPYAFGCKRISLEDGYFEIFDQDNVSLVDVNTTPIERVTGHGIKTSEKEWDFDYIICATGYDAFTGGMKQMDIRGCNPSPKGASKESLAEHWADATYTQMGLCVSGFPNMFFTYGPQAPTALCNGPTCAQVQGDWIVRTIEHVLRGQQPRSKIVAKREAEEAWRETIINIAYSSLLPTTKSWYMGDNIPGKTREPLLYLGGVPTYYKTINDEAEAGYPGFDLS